MFFSSWSDFFQMGKHGTFVWSAYGIVLIALLTINIHARIRHHRQKKQLGELKKRRNQ